MGQVSSNGDITLDTPDEIAYGRLAAIKGRLKLEINMGMRFKGRPILAIVSEMAGKRFSSKKKAMEWIQEEMDKALVAKKEEQKQDLTEMALRTLWDAAIDVINDPTFVKTYAYAANQATNGLVEAMHSLAELEAVPTANGRLVKFDEELLEKGQKS